MSHTWKCDIGKLNRTFGRTCGDFPCNFITVTLTASHRYSGKILEKILERNNFGENFNFFKWVNQNNNL
jgi:hypothetical protein